MYGNILSGPVNGHDIEKLIKVFHVAKRINGAVIIHVVTHKGHGYKPASVIRLSFME